MSLKRHVLNTTGLLALAVVVFYSSRYWPQRLPLLPPAEQPVTNGTHPDYSISAFHAIDLDELGRLRYELTADQLAHFPQPERAELVNPDMIFYRNSSESEPAPADPWELTAAQGEITEGGDKLVLTGNVHVARITDNPAISRMTMDTDHLTVYGKQEVATTDAAVQLASDRVTLTGVGMQIDMKKGQMHLLSRVRGNYEPR